MNKPTSLDLLFEFSSSRQENPRWLSRGGLRSFAVRLTNTGKEANLIVSERDHILSFSVRFLALTDLDDKARYKLCEYAMIRNRSPYEATFLATDRGLSSLWACYRVLSATDPELNLERYEYACDQLRDRTNQPLNLMELLETEKIYEDDTLR